MPEITIYTPDATLTTQTIKFPGGELRVKIPGIDSVEVRTPVTYLTTVARLQSAEDIVRLMFSHNLILGLISSKWVYSTLVVPYMPCGRQDRNTEPDVATTIYSMAEFINDLGYDRVQILDPHSDVTRALLNHEASIDQIDLIKASASRYFYRDCDTVVVSPDAGAMKKAWEVASYFKKPLVTGLKHRDVSTGEISGVSITDPGLVHSKTCFVADDICDGGRTFVELAKVLREAGASKVILYVTHGIFSKGLKVFDGLVDEIVTTNSFLSQPVLDEIARPTSGKTDSELYGNGTRLYVHQLRPTYKGIQV